MGYGLSVFKIQDSRFKIQDSGFRIQDKHPVSCIMYPGPVCVQRTGRCVNITGHALRINHGSRITGHGFTLLELIIVIFLITIILGISGFFFAGSTSSQRFNSSVREMAAALKYAKALASLDGEKKTFFIHMDRRTYGVIGKKTMSIPDGINLKVTDPVNGDIYNGEYVLMFYPSQGMPGVTIWLWDKKRTARIDTDPVAGTVMVRY